MIDKQSEAAPASSAHEQWSDLADLALRIAREIQFRGYNDQSAVSLSTGEGMVMRYLQSGEHASPTAIAEALGLQRTNLSGTMRGLEKKGLIERQNRPEDRRHVAVQATARGLANYRIVRSEWADAVSEAANFDESALASTVQLLREVEAGLVRTRPFLRPEPPR